MSKVNFCHEIIFGICLVAKDVQQLKMVLRTQKLEISRCCLVPSAWSHNLSKPMDEQFSSADNQEK
jgi:hypothetical protein